MVMASISISLSLPSPSSVFQAPLKRGVMSLRGHALQFLPPFLPSSLPPFLPSRLTRKFLLFLPFLSLPPPPPVNRSNRAEPSGSSRARFYTELCCATPFSALRRYKTQLGCCSGLSDIFNNLINVLRTLPAERPVARARQCPAQSAPLPCPVTLFCLARPRSSLSPPPPPSA